MDKRVPRVLQETTGVTATQESQDKKEKEVPLEKSATGEKMVPRGSWETEEIEAITARMDEMELKEQRESVATRAREARMELRDPRA